MKLFGYIVRIACKACALLGAGCVFLLVLWGMVGIFIRFIFDYQIPGQYEGASLLLILIVYLSIAYTQFEGGHVRMTLFISRAKKRKRELIEALNLLVCLIPSTILLWRTGREAILSFKRGEFQMGIYSFPEWPSRMALPIGFLLLCLCLVLQILKHLKSSNNHQLG